MQISIYSKVKTPDGVGVVVQMCCMRVNGLYFDPNVTEVTVWYGMDNVTNGWVQKTYDLKDISLVTVDNELEAQCGNFKNDNK